MAVAGDGFEEHGLRADPGPVLSIESLIDDHLLAGLAVKRIADQTVSAAFEMFEISGFLITHVHSFAKGRVI